MANEPLYITPDIPRLTTGDIIPPSPQLAPLVPFVKDPYDFLKINPKPTYNGSGITPDGLKKTTLEGIINDVNSKTKSLPYNKYDNQPIRFNNKLSQLYKDPELGFIPDRNNEAFYDADQSWLGDIGRTFLGAGANFAGTALSSIPAMISGIGGTINWLLNGRDPAAFSTAFDNPILRNIDDWMENVQNETRNYSGLREQKLAENNPILNMIPFYGNGFGEMMRSLGYGAGSIVGALAPEVLIGLMTGGTGIAPTLSAQIGRLVRGLERSSGALKAIKGVETLEAVGSATKNASRLMNVADTVINGQFGARSIISGLGEASFEAIETQKNLESELISQYREKTGVDPSADQIYQMRNATVEAANSRYLINVALLTLSNAVQFDALFKTFPVAKFFAKENAFNVGLSKEGFNLATKVGKEAVQSVESNWFKKAARASFDFGKEHFKLAPMEALEEGLQTATDYGTSYYAEHKWNGKQEAGLVLDSVLKGLNHMVSSNEGWSAMLSGFIAGSIQESAIDGLTSKHRKKQEENKAKITKALLDNLNGSVFPNGEINTDVISELFNINSIGGTVKDKVDNTTSHVGAQKSAKKAVEDNDDMAFQTAKDDIQFAFINQFVKHNQKESLDDIIDSWSKVLDQDPTGESFKKLFGLDAPNVDITSIRDGITSLKTRADKIQKRYNEVNMAYVNPFKPKTASYDEYNAYKTELVAQLFRYDRMKDRYQALEGNTSAFSNLDKVFNQKELNRDVNSEISKIEASLEEIKKNTPPEFKNDSDLIQMNQEDAGKLKLLLAMKNVLNKDFINVNQQEFKNLVIMYDDVFNQGRLKEESDIDTILNDVVDTIRLKNHARRTLDLYNLLRGEKGFEEFQKANADAANDYYARLIKIDEQTQQLLDNRRKDIDFNNRKKDAQDQFAQGLSELSQIVGKPIEELTDDYVVNNPNINQETFDKYALDQVNKFNSSNKAPLSPEIQRVLSLDRNADISFMNGMLYKYEGEGDNDYQMLMLTGGKPYVITFKTVGQKKQVNSVTQRNPKLKEESNGVPKLQEVIFSDNVPQEYKDALQEYLKAQRETTTEPVTQTVAEEVEQPSAPSPIGQTELPTTTGNPLLDKIFNKEIKDISEINGMLYKYTGENNGEYQMLVINPDNSSTVVSFKRKNDIISVGKVENRGANLLAKKDGVYRLVDVIAPSDVPVEYLDAYNRYLNPSIPDLASGGDGGGRDFNTDSSPVNNAPKKVHAFLSFNPGKSPKLSQGFKKGIIEDINNKNQTIKIYKSTLKINDPYVLYNNGTYVLTAHRSQNLTISGNEVWSFELEGKGFFTPLSSQYISKNGGTPRSIYHILNTYFTTNNKDNKIKALNDVKAVTDGRVEDLFQAYYIEKFLKEQAESGQEEVKIDRINKYLQSVKLKPIVLKTYLQGFSDVASNDEKGYLLKDLVFDRSKAFITSLIYTNRERSVVSYKFDESFNLSEDDINRAIANRPDAYSLISDLGSLLFFQDTLGNWNVVPVRTAELLRDTDQSTIQNIEQNINSLAANNDMESISDMLSTNIFFADRFVKGEFKYHEGRKAVTFVVTSHRVRADEPGLAISYKDPKKEGSRDHEYITIYLTEKDFENFNVKSFTEILSEKVKKINSASNVEVRLNMFPNGYRLQTPATKTSAEEFNEYSVKTGSPTLYDEIKVNYFVDDNFVLQEQEKNEVKVEPKPTVPIAPTPPVQITKPFSVSESLKTIFKGEPEIANFEFEEGDDTSGVQKAIDVYYNSLERTKVYKEKHAIWKALDNQFWNQYAGNAPKELVDKIIAMEDELKDIAESPETVEKAELGAKQSIKMQLDWLLDKRSRIKEAKEREESKKKEQELKAQTENKSPSNPAEESSQSVEEKIKQDVSLLTKEEATEFLKTGNIVTVRKLLRGTGKNPNEVFAAIQSISMDSVGLNQNFSKSIDDLAPSMQHFTQDEIEFLLQKAIRECIQDV